ncbi:MAG: EAL domain-containing protein [Pseudomonadota bacterium]
MRIQNKLLLFIAPFIVLPAFLVGLFAYRAQLSASTSAVAAKGLEQIGQIIAKSDEREVLAIEDVEQIRRRLEAQGVFGIQHILEDYAPSQRYAGLVAVDAGGEVLAMAGFDNDLALVDLDAIVGIFAQGDASQAKYLEKESAGSTAALNYVNRLHIGGQTLYLTFLIRTDNLISDRPGNDTLTLVLNPEREIVGASSAAARPWRISPGEVQAMLNAGENRALAPLPALGKAVGLARPLGHGFVAATIVPQGPIFADARNLAVAATVVGLVAVLITFLCIAFSFDRLLMRPLNMLKRAARAFGNGELRKPLAIGERDDEIGVLAASLEQMRRHLNESQIQTQRLVNVDALTGLPNRRSVMERLDAEIARARRNSNQMFSLMFIDLDNFKAINDSMGHKAGDRLVVKVAQRLVEGLRAYDSVSIQRHDQAADNTANQLGEQHNFVARLGGDEFLVIVNDIKDANDLARIAERLYALFEEPIYIDELHFNVSMSVGIVVYPGNGENAEQLIKNADVAMYSAKTAGKNQFRYYDPSMEESARSSLEIESDLRVALSENALELAFQPQFELDSGVINGCEVLLRWEHPERGWLSPAEFVPVAESCGLIHELGNWVLTATFSQIAEWDARGFVPPRVAINLSSHQIATEGLHQQIAEQVARLGVDPNLLEFELTETSIFKNREVVQNNLAGFRTLGARIALDDFGTGYSSLAWVRHCKVDTIKIDRSFVTDVMSEPAHRAIVASVLELSRQLNVSTVAEGIETEEQAMTLLNMGCHSAQGYLYSRALNPSAFESFVTAARQPQTAAVAQA